MVNLLAVYVLRRDADNNRMGTMTSRSRNSQPFVLKKAADAFSLILETIQQRVACVLIFVLSCLNAFGFVYRFSNVTDEASDYITSDVIHIDYC